jgi:hypothetical protein
MLLKTSVPFYKKSQQYYTVYSKFSLSIHSLMGTKVAFILAVVTNAAVNM